MDTKTQAMLSVLVNQRNQALDVIAQLAGEIAELREHIEVLEKKEKPKK